MYFNIFSILNRWSVMPIIVSLVYAPTGLVVFTIVGSGGNLVFVSNLKEVKKNYCKVIFSKYIIYIYISFRYSEEFRNLKFT